ncbi:MAG: hypothetical protein L0Y42_01940, partial [Phycisphaerales bacterium]|nr:hypothetical protein [Phycisphaerales bacterium]
RIMIGKNVMIEGPLGSRYGLAAGELDGANGDPLVLRSDFYFLDDALDANLNLLYEKVVAYDLDGDSRLRIYHPFEAQGVDASLPDYDDDEYVDDCDLFLAHYDSNNDKGVVFDSFLAGSASEYGSGPDDDLQLMRLIDLSNPDRDGDGDVGSSSDTIILGYNDGVIDARDEYAKVRGRLGFSVARDAWETPHGASFQTVVQGPVRSEIDVAPTTFEVSSEEMREITTEMFSTSQSWFENQAASTLDEGVGGTITEPSEVTPDAFDNTWEMVPYGAAGAYDHYNRRIYTNFTFSNLRIPMGTNALFENCKFVGVTYVETEEECSDHDWNYAGALEEDPPGSGIYKLKFQGIIDFATIPSTGEQVPDTRTKSNSLRFHDCTFLGSLSGDKPAGYTHWRNKIQMTGDTRFYLDQGDPDLLAQPDVDELQSLLNTLTTDEKEEMAKSSILMPGWSVDVGNFFNELGPKIKLKGTIIAGIFDIRGTAEVHGTLLMTHKPVAGEGPLYYGGLADAFNTTVGYFGPNDGDGEGTDPASASFQGFGEINIRYNPNGKLPDGIPWPIRIVADPSTYVE